MENNKIEYKTEIPKSTATKSRNCSFLNSKGAPFLGADNAGNQSRIKYNFIMSGRNYR